MFVGLENGLEGLLHISELADHKVENPEEIVKVGDEIEVKILRVDTEERKIGLSRKRVQWTAFVISGTVAGIAGALFGYLKGSVFPDSLGISLSVDALVMVLLGGVETVSGAVVGAIVYKALNIWLVSQTDLSKLVLGAVIVLIVVAFPKGIVGMLETVRNRRRSQSPKSPILASRIETAE